MVSSTKQSNINKSVLIGRCTCDNIVKFPFYWCEKVIDEAKKCGFHVVDLQKENFTEEKLTKHMLEHHPSIVFLNGHGDEFCAMGYKKEPVLIINKNDHLLKGKLAHVISCKTALFLGQSAVDKGCRGYIGYSDLFKFWSINQNPSEDIISKMFMESVNIVSITLLNNKSIEEAYILSQKVYDKHISQCMKILFGKETAFVSREYVSDILAALIDNKKNQVFISG